MMTTAAHVAVLAKEWEATSHTMWFMGSGGGERCDLERAPHQECSQREETGGDGGERHGADGGRGMWRLAGEKGMGFGQYLNFVCVEPARVARPVKLKPMHMWEGIAELEVQDDIAINVRAHPVSLVV